LASASSISQSLLIGTARVELLEDLVAKHRAAAGLAVFDTAPKAAIAS